ncbi:thyrotropin-releasing hormone-degrading ectoenzyme-like [Tenrec ecaudatus]|uniref:thyrotropin-releasing hormone-degrading ectoenzyme-like n=1 Tax=Tenrec ecaudatus TaxID=94439 RepID=UPI003F5958DF
MENWGLSIFVEQRILLDPSMSSISYLLDVTMVIVHEWFGDLVTPVWWEDVWLKEGFAHYFEFVGTDYLYPGWNMEKQRFLTDVLHEVMLLDGLASSHPVSQEVLQATDIDRVFDWIAYKKVGINKTQIPLGCFTMQGSQIASCCVDSMYCLLLADRNGL